MTHINLKQAIYLRKNEFDNIDELIDELNFQKNNEYSKNEKMTIKDFVGIGKDNGISDNDELIQSLNQKYSNYA